MDFGLQGKRALVTGGSHGVGLACAKALEAEGCRICICSRSSDRLLDAPKNWQIGQVDALLPETCNHLASQLTREWGGIDILINNVGGGGRWGSDDLLGTDPQVWNDVYQKNAGAAVLFTRWAVAHMLKSRWGRVVTIASNTGTVEAHPRPWFTMAKAAEHALMKSLAINPDFAKANITFNTVSPGELWIEGTATVKESNDDFHGWAERIARTHPRGKLGSAEEVASVVAFLCSQQASLVSGANILVDGGQSRAL